MCIDNDNLREETEQEGFFISQGCWTSRIKGFLKCTVSNKEGVFICFKSVGGELYLENTLQA